MDDNIFGSAPEPPPPPAAPTVDLPADPTAVAEHAAAINRRKRGRDSLVIDSGTQVDQPTTGLQVGGRGY